MEIEIYADVLFALNYLMDIQVLFLTSVLSRQRPVLWRLSGCTALLALYGTAVFYPEIGFLYSTAGRIGISALGIWLLCPGRGFAGFCKAYGVFWLVSMGMGGAVTALSMWTELGRVLHAVSVNGSLYLDIGLGTLLAGIGISYAAILGFRRTCVRNFSRDRILVKMTIQTGGAGVQVTGLLDTGCELTMPVTGDGVILIPRQVFGDKLPDCPLSVPIHTAGGAGRLPAFYPDVACCDDARYTMAGNPAVAVTEEEYAADGVYNAFINPEILRENKIKGGKDNEVESQDICCASAAKLVGKAGLDPEKKRFLHRRKRDATPAAEQGGGNTALDSAGPSGDPAECPPDADRTESAAGCVHCAEV